MEPLLIDIGALSPAQTDAALETIYKAISDPPGADGVWQPHDSPFVRYLIEEFTQRGLIQSSALAGELLDWLAGQRYNPDAQQSTRPDGPMARWSSLERELARQYLEALPPSQFTLNDWMLLVDWLVQKYLPADAALSQADWLVTRATLMGRVQAQMAAISEKQAEALTDKMPASEAAAVGAGVPFTAAQRAALEYGRLRCAENITRVSDDLRHRLRNAIMQYQEAQYLGDRMVTFQSLQTRLQDEFGQLNRDWRRIALTEAGENANQGLISSLPPGSRVKRLERYLGACPFCRRLDGRIYNVVSPAAPDKNGDTDVWVGKTNIGRAAAPNKRIGTVLVPRAPDEMWWAAAGVQHPHCRGVWQPVEEPQHKADPEFADWLDNLLEKKA